MKSETRRQKMAELFDDDEELVEILKKDSPEVRAARNETSREAEAVAAFLGRRLSVTKTCGVCGKRFMSDYVCIAFCSDPCRIAHLKKIGITWDPTKPQEERWGNPVPLVIPPSLVDHLRRCLEMTPLIPEIPEPVLVEPEPQIESSEFPEFEEELLDADFDDLLL